MPYQRIDPEKITKPIQLIAVWFIGLILLEGILIGGAVALSISPGLQVVLVIASVITPLIFIGAIFLLQTKYREQLLDDHHYAKHRKQQGERFKDFKPENISQSVPEKVDATKDIESWNEREARRMKRYEENRGLFLVHNWRPSSTANQIADISISIYQHGDSPLSSSSHFECPNRCNERRGRTISAGDSGNRVGRMDGVRRIWPEAGKRKRARTS